MKDGVAQGVFPGGVLLVSRGSDILIHEAFGRIDSAGGIRVSTHTLYDLASLTKVLATTLAVMKLVERSRLTLDDTLDTCMPSSKRTDKACITLRQLLYHNSGLPDYRDDSNIDKLIESLRKMQGLNIEKIISGHMDIAEKKDIQTSIDKLISFRKQVKKYVDANIPPEKAAESIKFPEGENPFFQQNFKKIIHKVYNDINNAKQ